MCSSDLLPVHILEQDAELGHAVAVIYRAFPAQNGADVGLGHFRIHDGDSELLRYLAENSITPGAVLAVVRPPVAGLVQVQVQDEQSEDQEVVPISVSSAADIRVSHAEDLCTW